MEWYQQPENRQGMGILGKGLTDLQDPRKRTMIRKSPTGSGFIPALPENATSNPVGVLGKQITDNTNQAMLNYWGNKAKTALPAPAEEEPTGDQWHPPMALRSDETKTDSALPQMARPERDMTPMIEANQAYARQKGDIGALASQERDVYDDMSQGYTPQGTSFGGLMSNLRSMEALEALGSRKGKSFAEQSGHVAALPYLSAMDKAGDSSREMPRYYDKQKIASMFSPTSNPEMIKADLDLKRAQAALATHQALPENLTSKSELQRDKIDAHARELGTKAYSDFLLKNPENQQGAMDAGMIAAALAQGKEVDVGSPAVPAVPRTFGLFGGKPEVPAVRPSIKGGRIIQDASGNKMIERNGRWEKL